MSTLSMTDLQRIWRGERAMSGMSANDEGIKLRAIESTIRDYHFALDTRQHPGVSAHKALEAIMAALDMPWVMRAELHRREKRS